MGKFRTDYDNYFTAEQLDGECRNHTERYRTIMAFLDSRQGHSILDVGAGTGILAEKLVEKKYPAPIMNCDIKKEYVKAMKDKGLNAVEGDIRNLPFKDREFDAVIAGEILEHLANPGLGLMEACRVAKKRVIFTLPVQCHDDFHGWNVRAERVGVWWVVEMERTEGNE